MGIQNIYKTLIATIKHTVEHSETEDHICSTIDHIANVETELVTTFKNDFTESELDDNLKALESLRVKAKSKRDVLLSLY